MGSHRAGGRRTAGRRRAHARRRVPVRLLLCLGILAAPAVSGTYAYWTDDVPIAGVDLTAGTLDLTVNGADPYASATLAMPAMVPGSSAAETLTVANAGTAPAKYTTIGGLSGTGAADYAAAGSNGLLITITDGTASGGSCGGTTLLAETPLTATTTTSLLSARPVAALAPAATDQLCVRVRLAAAAPSSLQGKTATLTLTVTGTSDVS